jgi:tRNA (guanine-N7-)-methyltransferase
MCPAFAASLAGNDSAALRRLYTITTAADPVKAAAIAKEHLATLSVWQQRRPIAEHTREAFARIHAWRVARGKLRVDGALHPLVIDSGCGTGRSSLRLADIYPNCDVVGIDRNPALLRKCTAFVPAPGSDVVCRKRGSELPIPPSNVLVVRADLVDTWRLMHAANWRADRHFILYPNPHPKPGDVKHRLYGDPVFPVLLALGGHLELRANWEGYLTDFAAATRAIAPGVSISGPRAFTVDDPMAAISLFESKYSRIELPIYKMNLGLDSLCQSLDNSQLA